MGDIRNKFEELSLKLMGKQTGISRIDHHNQNNSLLKWNTLIGNIKVEEIMQKR